MPISPTYPGVYIQEIPSGVRTITGVATSIAAFIGFFRRGPMNKPVQIFNLGDFERELGGLDARSEAGYAIQQFFLNGGSQAFAVRVASGGIKFAESKNTEISTIGLFANNEGAWGNNIRVRINYDNTSEQEFNLTITEYNMPEGRQVLRQEVFLNLSMDDKNKARFVKNVINDPNTGSGIVRIGAASGERPTANGTLSGVHNSNFVRISSPEPALKVKLYGLKVEEKTLKLAKPNKGNSVTLSELASALESAIRSADPDRTFEETKVLIHGKKLEIMPGGSSLNGFTFEKHEANETANKLKLTGDATKGPENATISGEFDVDYVDLPGGKAELDVKITPKWEKNLTINLPDQATDPYQLNDLAAILQEAIQNAEPTMVEFSGATVNFDNKKLNVKAGGSGKYKFQFEDIEDAAAPDLLAGQLKLTDAASYDETEGVTNSGEHDPPELATDKGERHLKVILLGEEIKKTVELVFAQSLFAIAHELENALHAADLSNPAFSGAKVNVIKNGDSYRIHVLAGPGLYNNKLEFLKADDDETSNELLLTLDPGEGISNPQEFSLYGGDDGDNPGAENIIGSQNLKTGLYALENVDLFNILCIPETAITTGQEFDAVFSHAVEYCKKRRAFFIVDTPEGIDDLPGIKDWLSSKDMIRSENASFYYPRVRIPDPLNKFRLRSVGASGTVAGLYARTDTNRGVWKAPAGTEANLRNVTEITDILTDQENGVLNPLGINCLRNFPVYGNTCWGARTLVGADQMASEWKYIPVRRLALFLEESLFRGTKWTVFEPNDEPLWSQIRLNIGAFMHNLFIQGAFQGTSPRDAYMVKCDKETTTQNHINLGIVNIVVGFAPLKPAEFVIINIQQLAGQIQS